MVARLEVSACSEEFSGAVFRRDTNQKDWFAVFDNTYFVDRLPRVRGEAAVGKRWELELVVAVCEQLLLSNCDAPVDEVPVNVRIVTGDHAK